MGLWHFEPVYGVEGRLGRQRPCELVGVRGTAWQTCAYALTDSAAYRYAYAHSHAYCDFHTYGYSYANTDSDSNQHAHSN